MTDIPLDKEFWAKVLQRIARQTRHADAEDLLHTAFLRLERYRSRQTVDNPAAFLVRTAVNIRIDNFRHDRMLQENHYALMPEEADAAPLQDEVVAARARLARVTSGINRLPPRTRDIFLMHRIDNLPYSEIASHFGISVSAVEKHMAKAMLFLVDWAKGW
jgi:RNA polymerase sigma-70 factor (ECF subfamily)